MIDELFFCYYSNDFACYLERIHLHKKNTTFVIWHDMSTQCKSEELFTVHAEDKIIWHTTGAVSNTQFLSVANVCV